jgi:tripartite-type tricarboxylate transporter receptor subunit TctC
MLITRRSIARLTLAALAAMAGPAIAQEFPSRPVKLIVPFAAGGGTDFFARLVFTKVGENMGQSVVIENKPGAATFIGVSTLKSAPADGYTIMLAPEVTYSINQSLFKQIPYDPAKDFAWISLTARFALLMVTSPSVPANTMPELIKLIAAKPGEFAYGSPGIGTAHHLAMELFQQRAGLTMTHVPFKGSAPAAQEVIAGRVPVMFMDLATAAPFLKAGSIKAIAVANARRLSTMPNLPTVAEAALPGFEASSWQGIVAPAGAPQAAIARLNAELAKAVGDAVVRQKLTDAGIEPLVSTPQQFADYVKSEATKWSEVVRKAKISMD